MERNTVGPTSQKEKWECAIVVVKYVEKTQSGICKRAIPALLIEAHARAGSVDIV